MEWYALEKTKYWEFGLSAEDEEGKCYKEVNECVDRFGVLCGSSTPLTGVKEDDDDITTSGGSGVTDMPERQ